MVEQGVLFNAEQLPSNRFQPEGSGRDIGYLRDVIPVVDALGAQLGQTDDETSGYFRIALKPGGNFLSPRWGGEDARGEVTITTRNFRGQCSRSDFCCADISGALCFPESCRAMHGRFQEGRFFLDRKRQVQ